MAQSQSQSQAQEKEKKPGKNMLWGGRFTGSFGLPSIYWLLDWGCFLV